MDNIQNPSAVAENATTPEAVTQAPSSPEGQPVVAAPPEAAHQTTAETEAPPAVAVTTDGDNPDGIPEKWVGKSLDDVIKAHREAERRLHSLSEENAKLKREQEAKVEAAPLAQPIVQAEAPPVQNVQSMEDWLAKEFDNDWSEDPKTATQRDRQRRDQWRTYQDNYTKQAEFGTAACEGRVPGMEDFKELVPNMQVIAKQLAPLINPVYETHPELLRAVYYIAKGQASTEKLKKVATAKSQVSKAVEQEKLAASAETTSANEVSATVDPWNMKTEDLKKLIGVADRSVEG